MVYKENDFIKVEYDMFANGILVQTTNEKKGKLANLKITNYKPFRMILGKNFLLKALDDDILTNNTSNKEKILELTAQNAFGIRKKELVRVIPKSAFDEQKLRAIVGMTYDFN